MLTSRAGADRTSRSWSRTGALLCGALFVAACTDSGEVSLDRASTSTTDPAPATTESSVTTAQPDGGVAGAAGIGDPYYPTLGNSGYDVVSYDLVLDWDAERGALDATSTITIVAAEDLDTFNLDLHGLTVEAVAVDGAVAGFTHGGGELTVDPPSVLPTGTRSSVVIDYGGSPEPIRVGTDIFRVGWHTDGRGAYVVSEPAGAATWFPANDHPTDKATFRFEVTVPEDLAVAANGVLRSAEVAGGRETFVYEAADPMATYLASIAIGDLVLVDEGEVGGVPLRSAYARRLVEAAATDFARTGEMMVAFQDAFGPYPFEVYGHLVVDETLGFALENQTLSIFGSDLVSGRGRIDNIVAHELAHQWFGNAVSAGTWRDIWLNEGFATYAEWVWAEAAGGPTIAESARSVHGRSDFGVPPGDPGPAELFQPTVYLRGGLALYALSVEIGSDAFRDTLRAWVVRHDDSTGTTADFRRLAEEMSGQDLGAFFDAWVYGAALPPLP